MDEIVKKVVKAEPASAAPTGQPGSLDREIRLRVRAKTLVQVARDSCFTHGAIANPVPVETNVRLNGQPLELTRD